MRNCTRMAFLFLGLLALAGCVTDGDLGIIEVGPEKKICTDTARVIGADKYTVRVDTVECDGPVGVRWK